jgi:cGMP-dependent protein kinase
LIHRDIKINNFIIENDGYLKLVDVGSSKKILNGYAKTMLGTPHYMAPEIIEGLNYSFSSDFYSIGICIYYLIYNKFPYGNNENDVYKIYQEILSKKDIFTEKKILNNEINELISKLLTKEPNIRYSNIGIIKSNNVFRGFDWDLLYAKKLKAPFLPKKQNKLNKDNLLNDFRMPFESFIEKEKVLLVERDTSHVKIENEISEDIGSGLSQKIDILNEDF